MCRSSLIRKKNGDKRDKFWNWFTVWRNTHLVLPYFYWTIWHIITQKCMKIHNTYGKSNQTGINGVIRWKEANVWKPQACVHGCLCLGREAFSRYLSLFSQLSSKIYYPKLLHSPSGSFFLHRTCLCLLVSYLPSLAIKMQAPKGEMAFSLLCTSTAEYSKEDLVHCHLWVYIYWVN